MRWRRVCVVFLLSACLSACGHGPGLIVMKNPQTGEIVQCRGVTTVDAGRAAKEAESCARAYEREGYVRISQ
ncbi:MAG TPA: hypothetical protein VGB82_12115 [Alphaproteobacteria bacterium]